jgi:signal peptidase I
VLAVAMRVFLFTSIIKIPSGSMEPAVMTGDYIIANKQIPGPRVFKDLRQFRIDGKVQTKRFKGIRKVRRNDILVFNFPYSGSWDKIDMDLNVYYLKRCVALPGDTFFIENEMYEVKNSPDSLGCIFRQRELSRMSQNDFPEVIWNCYPYNFEHYQWNIKDFGPLYVPASGAMLTIDTTNFLLYKNLIEYETDQTISVREGSVFLDDEMIIDCTFKLNYYFMAGDFIFDSRDSRYWGLLPEDCIIGKASFIWRSKNLSSGKIRWNRFFKKIR